MLTFGAGMSQRTTVFVSYSHRDSRWLERLQVHLRPIARRGDLALWDDTRIAAGERWRPAIRAAIARAAASVLLISADFLASDFIASRNCQRCSCGLRRPAPVFFQSSFSLAGYRITRRLRAFKR